MISMLLLLQSRIPDAHSRAPDMSTGSWIFMLAAWAFVATLLVWSFKRVLSDPK